MRWTIVLAGGDGSWLADAGCSRYGYPRPTQFCDFDGTGTLLDRTIARAEPFSPRERIVLVTQRGHRADVDDVVTRHPDVRRVEQPRARDTAPAVIAGLLHVLALDPAAEVLVLPSDHHVADEAVFATSLRRAITAAHNEPHRIALLGAVPDGPLYGHGWVLPGRGPSAPVEAFRDRPNAAETRRLRARGALVNTLVLAARARTLAAVLTRFCAGWLRTHTWAGRDEQRLTAAYEVLPSSSLSTDVLANIAPMLRLIPVPSASGWSDLGTPAGNARASAGPRAPISPTLRYARNRTR